MKFFLPFFLCALPIYAEFTISDGDRFVKLKLFAKDSLQINNFDKNENYRLQNTITVGFSLNGLVVPTISFNAFVELNTDMESGLAYLTHNYEPYNGYPYGELDNGRTWDFFRTRTDWQAAPYFKISVGYDYLSYGPARRNKLALRGGDFYWRTIQDTADYAFIKRPVPTPFIGWDLNLAHVSYSQHFMQLKNWKDYRKYLHAHRLDFKVSDNLNFGLTETVVYGESPSERRSMEPIYVLPFVPYLFAETYGGDKDNNGISADFSWKLFNRFEIYGELFIDDLDNITSFFDDKWWGNKWATSIGLAIDSAKIGIFNWDYNFEYTRIEPWVYTHHKGPSNDYSHFGNSLGSDLGPNSREFYSRMGFSYREFLRLDLSVSAVAKDTALGSRLGDIHTLEDPTDKKYLNSKSTLHYQEYGTAILFKPFSIWSIGVKQYLIFGEYRGKRTEIFSGVVW
ncbi:MAG: capsule assembly Wzi family protein [Fibromonadaceae bacterium]|jgi:hypothetical protein|nr:capsule assembly Wzi family protein [Fibromonadaceae bacterium]